MTPPVNKKVFTVSKDGKDALLSVRRPTPYHKNKGDIVYGTAFREAVEGPDPEPGQPRKGLMVRAKLDTYMRAQGLWDDQQEAEYQASVKRMWDAEKKLAAGGKAGLTKSQGRELAIGMRRERATQQVMRRAYNQLDLHTAEAYAEQRRFDYLASVSTVYEETGKPYFESVEDYKKRAADEDAQKAAVEFAKLDYGIDEDAEKNRPENKFLLAYGFADDSLRLINKDGKLVDVEGNLLDEDGRRVNAEGVLVDMDGNPIDAEGNYIVEFSEFLDDPGDEAAPAPEPAAPPEPEVAVEGPAETPAVENCGEDEV